MSLHGILIHAYATGVIFVFGVFFGVAFRDDEPGCPRLTKGQACLAAFGWPWFAFLNLIGRL